MKSRAGIISITAMLGVSVVVAGPAFAGGGNGADAKACQKSGFVNYSTTAGTTFKSADECTSYGAKGGTLVPLPDLVPDVACTATTSQVACELHVRNIGIGPVANKSMLLEGTVDFTGLTTANIGVEVSADGSVCIPGSADASFPNPKVLVVNVACTATLPSGQTLTATTVTATVQGNGTVTISAVVDPNNTITESNETNNTYSHTFPLTTV